MNPTVSLPKIRKKIIKLILSSTADDMIVEYLRVFEFEIKNTRQEYFDIDTNYQQ